ncbi:MAG: Uncharacterized protein G01um101418_555 [Parcubacteria group bacterium Gr01-1014_18]|nr:MAG: Uncharacterized protein Greene041636_601 [Parcubacteria group bacterium Greene0416_36]TSC80938.1 MAG: Uncharacterized protein G01um101418_555 [Parcubacteria group bacterium Gr01-1014_18]TSC98719.1 MAG: Uncharacterized protein Greene101420_593 [Parcubacteria group bacterium Greene1014_20]TSD06471.1 MAG: Uncharacterized protein Greene07142_901 [Parcubacteria group bacterium Greene0714_2]
MPNSLMPFFHMFSQKGSSLVEVIFYITVLALFVISMTMFNIDLLSGSAKLRTIQSVQDNLRFPIHKMSTDIRRSTGVNIGSSVFDTHPGVLSLQMASAGEDPTVYSISSGRLRVQRGAASPEFVTSSNVIVTNLVFKNLSVSGKTRNIQVLLTVSHDNPENINEYSWTESFQITGQSRKFP